MRKFLEKHGWTLFSSRRAGCFKMVEWRDGKTPQIMPQLLAVQTQRDRIKYAQGAPVSGSTGTTAEQAAAPAVV